MDWNWEWGWCISAVLSSLSQVSGFSERTPFVCQRGRVRIPDMPLTTPLGFFGRTFRQRRSWVEMPGSAFHKAYALFITKHSFFPLKHFLVTQPSPHCSRTAKGPGLTCVFHISFRVAGAFGRMWILADIGNRFCSWMWVSLGQYGRMAASGCRCKFLKSKHALLQGKSLQEATAHGNDSQQGCQLPCTFRLFTPNYFAEELELGGGG